MTTSYVIDATPMAFIAHARNRYDREDVASQLFLRQPDLLIGHDRHLPAGVAASAAEAGYSLRHSLPSDAGPEGPLLVLLPDPGEAIAEDPVARFPLMTQFALRRLAETHDSFFLVLEHEGPDVTSHNNSADALLEVLLSIDDAVTEARDFAASDGNTLLLFLADHETGGLYVTEEPSGTPRLEFGRTGHTAQHTPLFAFGPGASRFAGIHDNAEIGEILMELVD